jgi:hypothetical protein
MDQFFKFTQKLPEGMRSFWEGLSKVASGKAPRFLVILHDTAVMFLNLSF